MVAMPYLNGMRVRRLIGVFRLDDPDAHEGSLELLELSAEELPISGKQFPAGKQCGEKDNHPCGKAEGEQYLMIKVTIKAPV